MKKFLSVLLAVMMVLSTVSFAVPSAVGTMDTVVEEAIAVEDVAVEETATLAADISDDTSTYGEMIFELNFDDLDSISSQTIMFKDAGFINPEFDYTYDYMMDKASISFGAYPTYSIKERASGDKYLELSGGTGYAVTQLQSGTDRGFQGEAGVYTLTADVYRPDNMPVTTRFSGPSTEDTPVQDFEFVDGGWGKMKLQHDPSCFGNGGHEVKFESVAQVKNIKFHRNGGSDTKTVGYDNIRLYFKPLTVDVTIKANGKSVTKEVSTLEAVSINSLANELGLGVLYDVTGAKAGDKTYAATDSVVFTKDTTLELTVEKLDDKYIHSEYGLMLFDINFEDVEIGTVVPVSKSDFKVTNYATPVAYKVFAHDPSNWHLDAQSFPSGATVSVMADPANPANKVAGVKSVTADNYPCLMLTTYSNGAAAKYSFIDDNDIIYTLEYDYYDTTADGIALRFGGKSSVSENEGYTKWTTVEDTCNESNNGRAASTWYKNKGVYSAANASRMGGTDEISFIKMHTASPQGADLYWDNIRLYYKPAHVDIKLDANGMSDVTIATPTLTNAATDVKVSDLLATAGVDYSKVSSLSYTFKGVALDAEGTKVYGLNDTLGLLEDSTVYLIFEKIDMSEWTDENGILLYEVDFDDLPNGTQIKQSSKVYTFGRVNPYIEGSENWYFNLSGFGTVTNNDYGVVENGVLKMYKTSTGRWSQVQISGENMNGQNADTMIADGTITKFADMKLVTTTSGVTLGLTGYARKYNTSTGKWEGTTSNQNSVKTQSTVVSGEWYNLSGSKTLEGQEYNSESCTIYLPTYPAEGGIGDTFYLDNLKLYWKPAKVNVTVEGGQNAAFEKVVLNNVSTSATVADIIAMIPDSTTEFGKITGLADENGVKLTSLSLLTDVTLQPLWTPWVIIEGGQEFPVDEKGANKTQYSISYGNTKEVGNGGGQVTGAISWMYSNGWQAKNGNLHVYTRGMRIGDNNTGVSDKATWATPAVHSINDMIRENIHTTLAAGNDAEYVLIKYRYNVLPDLAEVVANDPNPDGYRYTLSADGNSLTYYDRTGATQTFDMAPKYAHKVYIQHQDSSYSYGGGEEFYQNVLMEEDVWYYDFLPVNANMRSKGVKDVIIQTWNRFDEQETEYDYVRFIKAGEELAPIVPEQPAPEYSVETAAVASIRTDNPQGIRFKADITTEVDSLASDYGWVVARDVAITGASLTREDLTVEQTAFKTKVGYGRQDSVDLKNYFEETDELKTFTAVIYNLPAGYEQDVLVARPFVKIDGVYYYGTPVAKSIYEVAVAVKAGGYSGLSEYQIQKIDAIIAAVEG